MATKSDLREWQPGRCLLTDRDFAEAYTRYTASHIPPLAQRKLASMGAGIAVRTADGAIQWMMCQ